MLIVQVFVLFAQLLEFSLVCSQRVRIAFSLLEALAQHVTDLGGQVLGDRVADILVECGHGLAPELRPGLVGGKNF